MQLRDVVSRPQLRWGDVAWGPVNGKWPGIAFAHGTSAWSQLQKINIDAGEVVLSVCVGERAEPALKRKVTGFSVPHHFTAPSRDLVEPDYFAEVIKQYGYDRWPDSIACRTVFRFMHPPKIDELLGTPRLITGTRGRYLSDIQKGAPDLYDKLANLEIEELELYRSQKYLRLAEQPRQASYRQAGWTPNAPKEIQSALIKKVEAIFRSAENSGKVYEIMQPERRVEIDETSLIKLVCELWDEQAGKCSYCDIQMETKGLAQISIDRIDNTNREYGHQNIHLTCWECNRGKGTATHEEMLELWEKRRRVMQPAKS